MVTKAGSPSRTWPFSAGLGGGEHGGVLVQVLAVGDVRVLFGHPWRHVPADVTFVAGGAGVNSHFLIRNVLLHQIIVAPVFHDDVHLAGGKALPGNLLVQVLLDHGTAKLVLRHVAVHSGIGRIPHPGVHRYINASAGRLGGTGGSSHLVHRGAPATCQEQGGSGSSSHRWDSSFQQQSSFFHLRSPCWGECVGASMPCARRRAVMRLCGSGLG